MKLSFVFLCLSLATLSLAAISSGEKEDSSLSRRKHREPKLASDKQVKKKPVKSEDKMLKKHLKKRAGVAKGVKKTLASAGKKSSAVTGSGKGIQEGSTAQDDCNKFALSFFPKALVELIGAYLEGFSVVFTRNWSAADSSGGIAIDSERHYLITEQDVQASSHGDDEPVSLGSPHLSCYNNFHSSHDGRSLFFTGRTKEQVSSCSRDRTARWLVQETGTKSLKNVTFEGGEVSFADGYFMLSANGKTLVSTIYNSALYTYTTSVYQIEEHGKATLASKKGDFDGDVRAVSGNGNRILTTNTRKWQLEVHAISGDGCNPVLEINYAGTTGVGFCALNNDGSKAAFLVDGYRLYIVDVDRQKGSISVNKLAPIGIPYSVLDYRLRYDAKDRLYAFGSGSLWLFDPSKREFVSLEKAQKVPQGYRFPSSAVSPNANCIALLFRSEDKTKKGEHQFQMVIKRDTKDVLMHLYRH